MILRNRLYKREEPSKEAKSIFIFCEGAKRERDYFNYFVNIDSRINIEVYSLKPDEDNSPLGLLEIAEKNIIKTEENPNTKYDFREGDEVWIVLDVDKDKFNSREPQFEEIKRRFRDNKYWFLALSNPCFEVWLYFHLYSSKPDNLSTRCSVWKRLVNKKVKGGFDARKHPVFIKNAINNSKENFKLDDKSPNVGCTEVYKLGMSFFSMVEDKINFALKQLDAVDK